MLHRCISVDVLKYFFRVSTGQGKLEKVGEFVWSGKGQGKILLWKSQGK